MISIEMGYQYVSSLTSWTVVPNSRLLVLFLLIILEMLSSAVLECAACVCFFRKLSFGKNPLKIYKTVRNEEPTVRLWEGWWNRVTHGEAVGVEKSGVCVCGFLSGCCRPNSTGSLLWCRLKKKLKHQIISFCLFKRVFLPIFGKQCLYFLMWASECWVGVDGAINSRSWSLHSQFIF